MRAVKVADSYSAPNIRVNLRVNLTRVIGCTTVVLGDLKGTI
jgi:hypothetical protein